VVATTNQPGNRQPAPAPLDLVQSFVNSWDREGGVEAFSSPSALAAWLRRHDLLARGGRLAARDVREAIELREAIRALLLEHNGEPASVEARATFSSFADKAVLAPHLDRDGGVVLAPARDGVSAVWARILAAIAQASIEGSWPRLKACRSDVCQWAFYDHSKNRSSHWCTMEICGSRDKMRRYRQRVQPSTRRRNKGTVVC